MADLYTEAAERLAAAAKAYDLDPGSPEELLLDVMADYSIHGYGPPLEELVKPARRVAQSAINHALEA
jgi:hypothetical protein